MKVLVVEDDLALQELYRISLEREGFTMVVWARPLAELLTAKPWRRIKPDVALIDYMMPRVDGEQVLVAAKKFAPGMRSVVVTARSDVELIERLSAIADVVVVKPVSVATLAAALRGDG